MSKALTLISIFFLLIPVSTSTPTLGLDAFLAAQLRRDPRATNDSFPLLPSSLLSSLFVSLSPSPLPSLHLPVPLTIFLVGPSFSSSSLSTLSTLLSAAISSSKFYSISPSSHLSLSHSLHPSPSLSSPSLSSSLSSALRAHLDSSPSPLHRSSLLPVPYTIIDRIIQSDFRKQSSSAAPAFYIYLLNLDLQSKPYAYSYEQGDASPAYTKCLGTLYTGTDRYLWIDLAAGPVDYGPATSGEGLLPRGEFHPLATLRKKPRPEKALLADLASLVLSAYQSLLVPSLRIPVFYENTLLVQFVHVHGSEEKDVRGLDWGFIEKTLRDGDLVFKEQELKFKEYSVKLSECPICSFGVSRSVKSFTSRFLFENFTLVVSEYLDSKSLRHVLSESAEELHRVAGIPEVGEYFGRVLPVYVFDLEYDKLLLLDRYHQAVAFRDMVIAVRTKNSHTVHDYSCNGRQVITQTRNLDRAIVGSVLQSMWGVSPTHLLWNPQHNSTMVDYTWSVGQTPFGPFSESSSLSFVQRDAVRRNVLLTTLNYSITSAIDILQSVAAHGGDRKLLKKNKHVEYVQRWNLLKYKLDKVVSAMSQLDFGKALYFLKSSDHDLYAIHTIVYQATQELEASLVCFKDPPFPWASVSLTGVFIFGFFYIYAKRDRIFKSKRKQF